MFLSRILASFLMMGLTSWASSFGGDSEHGIGFSVGSASAKTDKRFQYYSDLGVVSKQSDTICLTIKNSTLTRGTLVYLIDLTMPQSVVHAAVQQADPASCMRTDVSDKASSRYELRILPGESGFSAPAVGIVNAVRPLIISRGLVRGDLDGDGHQEYFRECTSSEGVHLSVWTGKPLVGRRRWHAYYYLGYDVDPDCTSKDTESTKQ
jgi:hypothetical protein